MFESRPIRRTINIEGKDPDKVLRGMLDRFRRLDLTNYYRTLSKDFEELHDLYFQSESSPTGDPWDELSDFTIEMKGFDTILVEKGDLLETLTGSEHEDAIRDIIIEGQHQSLTFGTAREYAASHNDGIGIVQREHVGVSDAVIDAVANQEADHIVGVMVEGEL